MTPSPGQQTAATVTPMRIGLPPSCSTTSFRRGRSDIGFRRSLAGQDTRAALADSARRRPSSREPTGRANAAESPRVRASTGRFGSRRFQSSSTDGSLPAPVSEAQSAAPEPHGREDRPGRCRRGSPTMPTSSATLAAPRQLLAPVDVASSAAATWSVSASGSKVPASDAQRIMAESPEIPTGCGRRARRRPSQPAPAGEELEV